MSGVRAAEFSDEGDLAVVDLGESRPGDEISGVVKIPIDQRRMGTETAAVRVIDQIESDDEFFSRISLEAQQDVYSASAFSMFMRHYGERIRTLQPTLQTELLAVFLSKTSLQLQEVKDAFSFLSWDEELALRLMTPKTHWAFFLFPQVFGTNLTIRPFLELMKLKGQLALYCVRRYPHLSKEDHEVFDVAFQKLIDASVTKILK